MEETLMTLTIDTSTRTIQRNNFEHHYTTDCFVNPESFDFHHSSWRGREPQAWCITNGGYIVAIVFQEYYAYCDQDALDEAADSGKLDFLQVTDKELEDYKTGEDSEGYPEYEGIVNLGNASEPFDQENLDYFVVPASLFSTDPIIMAVIEEDSRSEAIYMLQDFKRDAVNTEDALDETGNVIDAYEIVKHAIEHLRAYGTR
jgi:hypothetical protein